MLMGGGLGARQPEVMYAGLNPYPLYGGGYSDALRMQAMAEGAMFTPLPVYNESREHWPFTAAHVEDWAIADHNREAFALWAWIAAGLSLIPVFGWALRAIIWSMQ